MKQRGLFSISTLILLTLQQRPLTKTRLMQELVLNYGRINRYCDQLVQRGLIEYDSTTHRYSITTKGTQILKLNEELANFLPPINNMIKRYSSYIQEDGNSNENLNLVGKIS